MSNKLPSAKSGKELSVTLPSTFEVLSVKLIAFFRIWLIFKKKIGVNIRKACFFRKQGCLCMSNCAELFHTTDVRWRIPNYTFSQQFQLARDLSYASFFFRMLPPQEICSNVVTKVLLFHASLTRKKM